MFSENLTQVNIKLKKKSIYKRAEFWCHLNFPNVHIIASDELELSYNLILSATMFRV